MSKDREEVTLEQIALSNMYSIEAIVYLLVEKGILTMDEIIDKIKIIQTKHQQENN